MAAKKKVAKKKSKVKHRACSSCGVKGHNKRTCAG